jgi:hypothetical protein
MEVCFMTFPSTVEMLKAGYVFLRSSRCRDCGATTFVYRTPKGRTAPYAHGRKGIYCHYAVCPAAKAAHEAEKAERAAARAAMGQGELFQEEPF